MGERAYAFGRQLSKLALVTLFRFSVSGRENIPRRGGLIVAANHESFLDPLILGVACTRPVVFMAKKELFSVPVLGFLIRQVMAFPVDRGGADMSAVKRAVHTLKSGGVLGIFPEGGRQEHASRSRPEKGVGFLAVRAGVPVVPLFIKGSAEALPPSGGPRTGVSVSAVIGKPVDVRAMDYQEAADRVMDAIRAMAW